MCFYVPAGNELQYMRCVPQMWKKITDPIHLLNVIPFKNYSTYNNQYEMCIKSIDPSRRTQFQKETISFLQPVAYNGLACQTLQMTYAATGCIFKHQHRRGRCSQSALSSS